MQEILRQLEDKRRAARHGRRRAPDRGAARQGQADRARTPRAAARSRLLRRVGHVRRASLERLRHGRAAHPRRRRGHRPWHDQRPAGVRLQPGLHGLRRLAQRGPCREDLQDHGPGHAGRRAGDRAQRLRRRPHPGRRRLARRLCRRVPAQRPGLRRGAADVADHGAVRRRRRLFAGHDRLHLHGEGYVLHVRHRAGRGEDRHPRDRDARAARRRRHPHDQVGRRRHCVRERRRGAAAAAALLRFPAGVEPGAAAVAAHRPIPPSATISRSTRSCRSTRTSPTTCAS